MTDTTMPETVLWCKRCLNTRRGTFCWMCGEQLVSMTPQCSHVPLAHKVTANDNYCSECGGKVVMK